MSKNHFSSTEFLETPWWIQHQDMMETSIKTSSRKKQNTFKNSSHWANNNSQVNNPVNSTNTAMFCTQNTAFAFNLNSHEEDEDLDENLTDEHIEKEEEQEIVVKEALFEKPLTPSDVGKLNRLVIPKQHAEKYFPLSGSSGGGGGSDSGEKGLLLSFEDESGKLWRFRYSYWNSSQSYVLTKGWSRFVKEKKLDAGDIVLFERHQHGADRFFIGCRRKGTLANSSGVAQPVTVATGGGGGGRWNPSLYPGHPYPLHVSEAPFQGSVVQQKQTGGGGGTSGGNSKRLRLFGVNMECQDINDEPSTPPDHHSTSSLHQAQPPGNHRFHHYHPTESHAASYQHHQTHMQDFNFSRDVNQMRYHHQG